MKHIRRIPIFLFALALLAALAPQAALAAAKKVDINTASQEELETLPGVGEATAKKIIAGRPYSSIGDLARAGVPGGTIQKISSQVKAGRSAETKAAKEPKEKPGEKAAAASSPKSSSASSASSASASSASASSAPAGSPAASNAKAPAAPARSTAAGSGQVDVNTASQKDLEALPGVGVVTAKKIIAGRPYASVNDLARAGVSHSTLAKISSRITVGAGAPMAAGAAAPSSSAAAPPAAGAAARPAPAGSIAPASPASSAAPAPASASSAPPAPASRSGSSPAGSEVAYQPPPAAGMVWVNLDSKVFHRQGDRWYGKTKHGRYMTESDALADGNRESKTH